MAGMIGNVMNYLSGINVASDPYIDKNAYRKMSKLWPHCTSGLTPFETSEMIHTICAAYHDPLLAKGDVSAWDGSVWLGLQLAFFQVNKIRFDYSKDEIKAMLSNYSFNEIFKTGITDSGIILLILAIMASGSEWTSLQNSDMNYIAIASGLIIEHGFKLEELIVDTRHVLPTVWIIVMGDDSALIGESHDINKIDLANIYKKIGMNGREVDVVNLLKFDMLSHHYGREHYNGSIIYFHYKSNRVSCLKLSVIWKTYDGYTTNENRLGEIVSRQASYVFNYPFVVELRLMLVYFLIVTNYKGPLTFDLGYGDSAETVTVPDADHIFDIINNTYAKKGKYVKLDADCVLTVKEYYENLYTGYVREDYPEEELIRKKFIRRRSCVERYYEYLDEYPNINEIVSLEACRHTDESLKKYNVE